MRLLFIFLCLAGLSVPAGAGQDGGSKSQVGSPAPAFLRSSLEGKTVRLASFHGRVVLLNFWASWCAPCLAEMPVFAQWQRENRRELQVIGASMDDDVVPARQVAGRLQPGYPLVMGDAVLARAYGGVLGLPVTFLIDRQGRVRQRFDGAADLQAMHAALERLLR